MSEIVAMHAKAARMPAITGRLSGVLAVGPNPVLGRFGLVFDVVPEVDEVTVNGTELVVCPDVGS